MPNLKESPNRGHWSSCVSEKANPPERVIPPRPRRSDALVIVSSSEETSWPIAHQLGDLRYCPHGRIQIVSKPGPGARFAGPGSWVWVDVPRWLRPRTWRAARALLEADNASSEVER